jgi:hypothetical protein
MSRGGAVVPEPVSNCCIPQRSNSTDLRVGTQSAPTTPDTREPSAVRCPAHRYPAHPSATCSGPSLLHPHGQRLRLYPIQYARLTDHDDNFAWHPPAQDRPSFTKLQLRQRAQSPHAEYPHMHASIRIAPSATGRRATRAQSHARGAAAAPVCVRVVCEIAPYAPF